MIDRLFLSPVEITVNGEPSKVSTLEGILLQLWLKEVSGNRAALSTRLKYQELAIQTSERRVEITFVDSDYTKALAIEPLNNEVRQWVTTRSDTGSRQKALVSNPEFRLIQKDGPSANRSPHLKSSTKC
jgi:hypothetical protein